MSATPPQQQPDPESVKAEEINTAGAILSLSGPCRNVGDIYLVCVATQGLGMCRSLRASFEQCSRQTSDNSKEMLGSIGAQMFSDLKSEEQTLSAARMVNDQLFRPQQ